ncbi:MAG: hypothetical protein ACXABH_13770, partial [Candidatus Thorarchaeota archaeon]
MKVVYKKWNPDDGLEEVQAKIYTEASGLPARAEEIKPRNETRGVDSTRYALTKDGEPLAYVTSWIHDDDPTEGGIGYPWSLKDCPEEAKLKIFDELFTHLKTEKKLKEINTGIVVNSKLAKDQVKFFKKRGFEEYERAYRYTKDLDVEKLASKKLDGKYAKLKSKIATKEDVDTLIEVSMSDPQLRRAFPDEEAWRNYFENRVMEQGNAIMLLDGDKVVAASAALKLKPDGIFLFGEEERVLMRFTAIRPGYRYVWKRLAVEIAKDVKKSGIKGIPIRVGFGFSTNGAVATGIAGFDSDLEEFEIFMKY